MALLMLSPVSCFLVPCCCQLVYLWRGITTPFLSVDTLRGVLSFAWVRTASCVSSFVLVVILDAAVWLTDLHPRAPSMLFGTRECKPVDVRQTNPSHPSVAVSCSNCVVCSDLYWQALLSDKVWPAVRERLGEGSRSCFTSAGLSLDCPHPLSPPLSACGPC